MKEQGKNLSNMAKKVRQITTSDLSKINGGGEWLVVIVNGTVVKLYLS